MRKFIILLAILQPFFATKASLGPAMVGGILGAGTGAGIYSMLDDRKSNEVNRNAQLMNDYSNGLNDCGSALAQIQADKDAIDSNIAVVQSKIDQLNAARNDLNNSPDRSQTGLGPQEFRQAMDFLQQSFSSLAKTLQNLIVVNQNLYQKSLAIQSQILYNLKVFNKKAKRS